MQQSKDMFRLFFLVMCSTVFTVKAESGKVATVMASPGQGPERSIEIRYTDAKVVGNGSFGVVYQARLMDSNEMVAIKKVLQDKRFKVTALNLDLLFGVMQCKSSILNKFEVGKNFIYLFFRTVSCK